MLMSDKVFAAYDWHSDVAANRPATPTVSNGRLYGFAASDTGAISIWNGTAWVTINSGAPPTGAAGGSLTGTYPNPTIAAGVITEAMQVLANNTTNDVSSTLHGYAPKSPADATKFLNGAATPAYTRVSATLGTTTNDNAANGDVGEYVEASVTSGSGGISLTTGNAKTVTSISLTAGDWDVTSLISFFGDNPGARRMPS